MKRIEVQGLKQGLYRLFWKSGGSSLASVGSRPDGRRWMAPANWTSKGTAKRKYWREVSGYRFIVGDIAGDK